jgi:hypothetical protein
VEGVREHRTGYRQLKRLEKKKKKKIRVLLLIQIIVVNFEIERINIASIGSVEGSGIRGSGGDV